LPAPVATSNAARQLFGRRADRAPTRPLTNTDRAGGTVRSQLTKLSAAGASTLPNAIAPATTVAPSHRTRPAHQPAIPLARTELSDRKNTPGTTDALRRSVREPTNAELGIPTGAALGGGFAYGAVTARPRPGSAAIVPSLRQRPDSLNVIRPDSAPPSIGRRPPE
jgi:hypothetical protein